MTEYPATPRTVAAPSVPLERWGSVGYGEAFERQKQLHQKVVDGADSRLIFCSHPPVFSLGRQTKDDHLPMPRAMLEGMGAEVHETDRGGSVTFHGPGQLVGYPIFRLGDFPCGEDLHKFLRDLEEVLIRAVGELGIKAERNPGKTGIWVDGAKLAAIGLKCSRWVTMHGFALNVDTDLTWFSRVVPCGLTEPVTSLAILLPGQEELHARIESAVLAAFSEVFGCSVVGE